MEIGCGTGHFTRWIAARAFKVFGIDAAWPMVREARRLMSPPCLQGVAQAPPFPDQSVDLVVFMTTLEFVNHPLRALEEAVRVGREGLILGVLNHQSLLRLRYQASGKSLGRPPISFP